MRRPAPRPADPRVVLLLTWSRPPRAVSGQGALYTAKGVASVLAGPLTSWAVERASWETVLLVMAAASACNAGLALCVLRRLMRRRGEGGPRWTNLVEEQEGKVKAARREPSS